MQAAGRHAAVRLASLPGALWRLPHSSPRLQLQLPLGSRAAGLHAATPLSRWEVRSPGAAAAGRRPGPDAPATPKPLAVDDGSPKLAKRKVALHIGYEGTEYRGLQSVSTAGGEAIEDELEEAIFRAGCMLESNRGKQSKVGWTRSSRTDKSVHSVSTVVALKLEVEPDTFDTDPEGQALCAAINAHLPPEVRIFSIQRVSKSWSARSECIRRSYSYYVPASLLGLALDGGEEDARRLALLSAAWSRFQGSHAFHNYTKRRLYREAAVGGNGRRRRKGKGQSGGGGAAASVESSMDAEESEGEEEEEVLLVEAEEEEEQQEAAPASSAASSGSIDSGEGEAAATAAAAAAEGGQAVSNKGRIKMEWKYERDEADVVGRRHFRFVEWCTADTEARPLVPGGTPCVLLSLEGSSFMLHQIRHMVAMAVAVARGHLPLELVDASLASPARLNLPLAPPSTLMLMTATFSPFRRSWAGHAAAAAQWTGDVLELKEAGRAAQQAYLQETMLPALDELLAAEEWRKWDADLNCTHYDPAQLESLLATHREWLVERAAAKLVKEAGLAAKKAAAAEEKAAEAAAAAAEKEAAEKEAAASGAA